MITVDDVLAMCRVRPGKKLRLKDHDPGWAGDPDVPEAERKALAREILSDDISALAEAQEVLYAADSWSVLAIFQAMDAAGKDGAIKHVMSGINPQGCQVFSFKHPSAEELDHDFLWRCHKCMPERGRIGIFNRSYYEEVLVVRVHPEYVKGQRIPGAKVKKSFWKGRYEDILNFEQHLSRNGTKIVKFFLNVSRDEQRRRLLDRINDPHKQWKFSLGDLNERALWDDYMEAYSECLEQTSTSDAPWYIVPADEKWVTRAIVAKILVKTIESLDLKFPQITADQQADLEEGRRRLEAEGK